jgi:hypothetical protein
LTPYRRPKFARRNPRGILGNYEVCLPTAGSEGRLVYRRIARMRDDAASEDIDGEVAA